MQQQEEKMYTGQYGIVLLPDPTTRLEAARLARISGNRLDIGGVHVPHVTLYHTKLVACPAAFASTLLQQIQCALPREVEFCEISAFGGKFLFWDVAHPEQLAGLHLQALELSKYFETAGKQQADKEELQLSALEQENVALFGHPLVRVLYRPHITLGYFDETVPECDSQRRLAQLVRAHFVRVGEYGTLAEIVL